MPAAATVADRTRINESDVHFAVSSRRVVIFASKHSLPFGLRSSIVIIKILKPTYVRGL